MDSFFIKVLSSPLSFIGGRIFLQIEAIFDLCRRLGSLSH